MGRAPCCEKEGLRRGAWSPEEDQRLVAYIRQHGHPNWRALPKHAGLLRCGKSCRLRWINYLRPDIKRGNFTADEEELIVRLHRELGNRWSAIAAQLPGRTDNEIKNVWHTHIKKRLEDADIGGRSTKSQARKSGSKPAKNAAAAKVAAEDGADDAPSPFAAASPGLSSSVSSGVTCSAATESTAAAASSSSADNAATTSASQQLAAVKAEETESFSTAEFPPIDESFWTSPDVMDMDLGAMDEELGLASSASTRDEDMEFWLKMLLESGDMRDLSVL